jgi:hypothetical protein
MMGDIPDPENMPGQEHGRGNHKKRNVLFRHQFLDPTYQNGRLA